MRISFALCLFYPHGRITFIRRCQTYLAIFSSPKKQPFEKDRVAGKKTSGNRTIKTEWSQEKPDLKIVPGCGTIKKGQPRDAALSWPAEDWSVQPPAGQCKGRKIMGTWLQLRARFWSRYSLKQVNIETTSPFTLRLHLLFNFPIPRRNFYREMRSGDRCVEYLLPLRGVNV